MNVKRNYIGFGVVGRDIRGNFLGAKAITKNSVASPKVAEAMAALEAILFCKEACFFYVILEGDTKQVVGEVHSINPNFSVAGHFIEEIKTELQGLRNATMVHVGRDANSVAHCLAKEASTHEIDSV
jgi:ribonuclease HI